MFNSFAHNVQIWMWSSIAPNSQGQYQIGWNHYLQFIDIFGTNILMDRIPSEYTTMRIQHRWSFSLPETIFLGYLNYLRVQLGVSPKTAFSYMSAVRFMLKCHNMDTAFLDRSESIRATRSGMMLIYRNTSGNSEADVATMPMTTDMVQFGINTAYNDNTYLSTAIRTAMTIAFCMMMRIGEYIMVPNSDHHLLGKSVIFGIKHNITGEVSFISSDQAYMYPISSACQVIVTVRSAKNDKFGLGHRFCFQRNVIGMPNQAFDVTAILFEWAQIARPSANRPFLSWITDSKVKTLSSTHINKAIKNIARHYGFGDTNFSSHSLRIGGASVLAAAQVPDYTIQLMGRWKSLAFLDYIRLSTTAFNKAINIMSNVSTFTSTDLLHISSSAALVSQRQHIR